MRLCHRPLASGIASVEGLGGVLEDDPGQFIYHLRYWLEIFNTNDNDLDFQ